jgi:hypothetical protein
MDEAMAPDPNVAAVDQVVERVRARREQLRQAEEQLASAAAAPYPGRLDLWWARVAHAADELVGRFTHHLDETEGEGGLFADVEAVAPRLSSEVDRLRAEHQDIGEVLDELARHPTPATPEEVSAARELILEVLARLARHRFAGSDLLYEAYQVDLGGPD